VDDRAAVYACTYRYSTKRATHGICIPLLHWRSLPSRTAPTVYPRAVSGWIQKRLVLKKGERLVSVRSAGPDFSTSSSRPKCTSQEWRYDRHLHGAHIITRVRSRLSRLACHRLRPFAQPIAITRANCTKKRKRRKKEKKKKPANPLGFGLARGCSWCVHTSILSRYTTTVTT